MTLLVTATTARLLLRNQIVTWQSCIYFNKMQLEKLWMLVQPLMCQYHFIFTFEHK